MDESACFSQEEMSLLDPAVTRITEMFERLSSIGQLTAIEIILSTVFLQYDLNESFNPLEFLMGERTQEQRQLAA